jgi:hypothetical protein
MDAVLRAHKSLRTADAERFSDHDLKTVIAFSALGIPESAFKKLNAEDYWKIDFWAMKPWRNSNPSRLKSPSLSAMNWPKHQPLSAGLPAMTPTGFYGPSTFQ